MPGSPRSLRLLGLQVQRARPSPRRRCPSRARPARRASASPRRSRPGRGPCSRAARRRRRGPVRTSTMSQRRERRGRCAPARPRRSAASTASPSSRRAEVEHDARREEPLQRQLVDRLRRLAADRRVVVPGRVDVGRVVGAEAQERLDRPALAVAQQLGPDAEHRLDRLGALGVVARTRSRCAAGSGSSGGDGVIGAERSTKRVTTGRSSPRTWSRGTRRSPRARPRGRSPTA